MYNNTIITYLLSSFSLLTLTIILILLIIYFNRYLKRRLKNKHSREEEEEKEQYKKKANKLKHSKPDAILIKKENYKESGESIENVRIVGIKEPIGKWTRFVMSEKLQKMLGFDFSKKHKGFWQMMIKMESASQGKTQGKSRGGGGPKKGR